MEENPVWKLLEEKKITKVMIQMLFHKNKMYIWDILKTSKETVTEGKRRENSIPNPTSVIMP